jgi:hypothetical protein
MHTKLLSPCVISGLRREVAENCAVLDYYAASIGNFLPAFRDNLSVHPQGSKIHSWNLRGWTAVQAKRLADMPYHVFNFFRDVTLREGISGKPPFKKSWFLLPGSITPRKREDSACSRNVCVRITVEAKSLPKRSKSSITQIRTSTLQYDLLFLKTFYTLNNTYRILNTSVTLSQQSSTVFATHMTRITFSFVLGMRRKTQTNFVGYTHIFLKPKCVVRLIIAVI